jgi:type IV secretion/conjugal transfer VirB4 family ATPase
LSDDITTITKDGIMSRVFELQGKDYTGSSDDNRIVLHDLRKQFFESVGDYLRLTVISHRHRLSRDIQEEHHGNYISDLIAKRWSSNFKSSFRTRHFVQLSTKTGGLIDRAMAKAVSIAPQSDIERLNLLDDVGGMLQSKLSEYRAKLLKGDFLAGYWAWLLNGKSVQQKMPYNRVFDDLLCGTDLIWPDNKKHQIYRAHTDSYSAWLTIKSYHGETGDKMLDVLFETPREFSLIQHYDLLSKDQALYLLNDKIRFNVAFTQAGVVISRQLEELINKVQAGELQICVHSYAIQVYGETLQDLEAAVSEVGNAIESWGIRIKRENKLQEPLFWSQFPGYEKLNVRRREITTENFTQFVNFSSIGEGLDSCSWGNSPAVLLKTPAGTEYSFVPHESTDREALGHMLIVGGPGSGKTTFMSFFETNILKYPGMRILNFDRLHGMEIATRMQDGHYEDFNEKTELCPFQMDDTHINRVFLANWLQQLSGKTDDESMERIHRAIDMVYQIPKGNRCLEEMVLAFGNKGDETLMTAMSKWLPGGVYDQFFTGTKDSLTFNKRVITYDMTTLLDVPDVLGPLARYIFHRLEQTIHNDPTPFFIFVDEFKKYLENVDFAQYLNRMSQEYRKLNGVFAAGIQQAGHLLDHPEGAKMRENFATYLLFPATSASEEHYVGGFGLTETEFKWIKKGGSPRQVLMKRKSSGESAILNLDLSSIGELLKVYNSGAPTIKRLNQLRRTSPDWKQDYLNE